MPLSVANSVGSRRYSISKPSRKSSETPEGEAVTRTALQALSHRQKVVLVLGATSQTLQFFADSMIPLLLPPESVLKSITHIQYGIIMAVMPLMLGLVDPLTCYIIPSIGIKPGFVGSALIAGIGYFCFGLLHWVSKESVFFVFATLIRFIQGANFAVSMVVGTTMMCLSLGESAGLGFAIGAFTEGAGYTLGPLIAGPLAQVTSFAAPLMLAGILVIILAIIALLVLEHQFLSADTVKFEPKDAVNVMTDRLVMAGILLLMISGFTWVMVESTLEQHLAEYEHGLALEGLIFALSNASFGLTAPLWSYLGNKGNFSLYSLLASPFIAAFANMFLGPIPGLGALKGHLGLDLLCLVVVHISMSISSVGASSIMLQQAEMLGLRHNVATFTLVGALWYSPYCLGETIGMIAGPHVFTSHGFPVLTLINAVFLLVAGTVALLIVFCNRSHVNSIIQMEWPLPWLSLSRSVRARLSPQSTDKSETLLSLTSLSAPNSKAQRSDYGSMQYEKPLSS